MPPTSPGASIAFSPSIAIDSSIARRHSVGRSTICEFLDDAGGGVIADPCDTGTWDFEQSCQSAHLMTAGF